jgi:GNAT superfamily N-acetyltransferase
MRPVDDHCLPAGLTARPLRPDDVDPVLDLIRASEAHDAGEALVERSDIEADWARPSTDLSLDTVGVHDGDGRLLGMAEVGRQGTRAEGYVHPAARGRGIGTFLAGWSERRAARLGAPRVGQAVPEGSEPHRFLLHRGYEVEWTSWVLQLLEGAAIPRRALPAGYRLETAARPEQHRGAHRVVEDAFGEWSSRESEPYEEWAPGVVGRSGFEPWMLRVVEHDDDGVVGACFTRVDDEGCGFVHQLAVDRRHRGRGLAQVLLADGFEGARRHGATRSELTTDSRTGALDLYLKVGMQVTSTWLHLSTDPVAAISR